MHHVSEKCQAIHSSVTALGLLKKKKKEDERNVWAVISRTPTLNMIPMKLNAVAHTDTPVRHI